MTLVKTLWYSLVKSMLYLISLIYFTCFYIVWDMAREAYDAFRSKRIRDNSSTDDKPD